MSKNAPTSSQRTRFAVIESLLRWEGEVSNRRLRELWGIKPVPASRLISAYRKRHPHSVHEDAKQKRFVPADFKVMYGTGSLEEYLQEVRNALPNALEDARSPIHELDATHFSRFQQALQTSSWVLLCYLPWGYLNPVSIRVYPRKLVNTDAGWYVRAWVEPTETFEILSLARVLKVAFEARGPHKELPVDTEWDRKVVVRLQVHRELAAEQELAIRREYFNGSVARRLALRAPLVPIVLRHLRVAMDPTREKPPQYVLEVSEDSRPKLPVSQVY